MLEILSLTFHCAFSYLGEFSRENIILEGDVELELVAWGRNELTQIRICFGWSGDRLDGEGSGNYLGNGWIRHLFIIKLVVRGV